MHAKLSEKKVAIELRKQGKTYGEILKEVKVSQSTLSLWLRNITLSGDQVLRIQNKRYLSQLKGAGIVKKKRKANELAMNRLARQKINNVNIVGDNALFISGLMLYWAEGSKQKEHNVSQPVIFNNTDPRMVRIFILWLEHLGVKKDSIKMTIYIHENQKKSLKEIKDYWILNTGLSESNFGKIYHKHHAILTTRKNISNGYFGLARIGVSKSTQLNRLIKGCIDAICETWGVV